VFLYKKEKMLISLLFLFLKANVISAANSIPRDSMETMAGLQENMIGILCYHQDRDGERWLSDTCDIIKNHCSNHPQNRCVFMGKLPMTNENWKVVKSTDMKSWGETLPQAQRKRMRLVVFVAAHGLRPAFGTVGKGDMIGCGGKIGDVDMSVIMKKFGKLAKHRMEAFGSPTLFVANSCHGGYLSESEYFREGQFPIITVNGHGSGKGQMAANANIFGAVSALILNQVVLCIECYAGSHAVPSLTDWENQVKTVVIPEVEVMIAPIANTFPAPNGFHFDSSEIRPANTNSGDDDSSRAWTLISPQPFQFSDWNLDPEYLVLMCIVPCDLDAVLYRCTHSFQMRHRFHSHPDVIAMEYRSQVTRGGGMFSEPEVVSPDEAIDLDGEFISYDVNGDVIFRTAKTCTTQGGNIWIKLLYDISQIFNYRKPDVTFGWDAPDFSECPPECAVTLSRAVICRGSDGFPASMEVLCNVANKPAESLECPGPSECTASIEEQQPSSPTQSDPAPVLPGENNGDERVAKAPFRSTKQQAVNYFLFIAFGIALYMIYYSYKQKMEGDNLDLHLLSEI